MNGRIQARVTRPNIVTVIVDFDGERAAGELDAEHCLDASEQLLYAAIRARRCPEVRLDGKDDCRQPR